MRGLESLAQFDITNRRNLVLSGDLVPPTSGLVPPGAPRHPIVAIPLLDWVVEYSAYGSEPRVWAVTAGGWYRLAEPAPSYRGVYTATMQQVTLAQRSILESANASAEEDPATIVGRLTAGVRPRPSREAIEFAVGQLEARLGRRSMIARRRATNIKKRRGDDGGGMGMKRARSASKLGRAATYSMTFIEPEDPFANVSDDDMPDDFDISDEEDEDSKRASLARRRAWQKMKYWRRRIEEEQRAETYERNARAKEEAADASRGAPPEPYRTFRVPMTSVPDLLALWEFSQTFGDFLQIPPFTFASLEAAVCPGPRLCPADGFEKDVMHRHIAASPSSLAEDPQTGNGVMKSGMDLDVKEEHSHKGGETELKMNSNKERQDVGSGSVEALAMTRIKLKLRDGGAAADAAAQHAKMLKDKYGVTPEAILRVPVIDKDFSQSGVLLRDVFCALWRAAVNAAPRGEQPADATLRSEDSEHALPWPERVSNFLLGSPIVPYEIKHIAVKLAYGDYLDLTVSERLQLLGTMCQLALESDQSVNEVTGRQDAMSSEFIARDVPDEDFEGTPPASFPARAFHTTKVQAGASEDPLEGGDPRKMLDDWAAWTRSWRLGLRRPLGKDVRGRRYWALGGRAGAFRVYVEEMEGKLWGWYEGEVLNRLLSWLEGCKIRCEAPLLRALKCCPLPTDPSKQNKLLAGPELAAQRADGYKSIGCVPLLRGEWHTRPDKIGLYLQPDKRTLLVIDAILGVVPWWFRGETAMNQHLVVWETLSSCTNAREAAAALLEAERLLSADGKMSGEWKDVWQGQWRRATSFLTDLKEAPLFAASLQTHITAENLIPRQAFVKYAIDIACPLTFPIPGDNVVVMRAGLLRHIDRYMQLLGMRPMDMALPGVSGKAKMAAAAAAEMDDEVKAPLLSTATEGEEEEEEQVEEKAAVETPEVAFGSMLAPKIRDDKMDALKAQWEDLRGRVAALDPVQRYSVRSVTYRKHLADVSDLEDPENFEIGQLPRWPVAWLFLRPAKYGPRHQLPALDIAVPMAIDMSLPDYMVKTEVFKERTRIAWQPGDKFRMFFGGKISSKTHRKVKTGGVWYKGTVEGLTEIAPNHDAPLDEKKMYDPWESVLVLWEKSSDGVLERVSPWEIEIDPEEERRRAEEARRQQQAAQRAQRSRLKSIALTEEEIAEAAAQEEELEVLIRQAERSAALLRLYEKKLELKEEDELNETAYGQGDTVPKLAPLLPVSALQAQLAAKGGGAGYLPRQREPGPGVSSLPPLPSSVPTGPLTPGQEVSEEVLDLLRPLSREEFTTLLTNFYKGLKGKYKIPTFAHAELDLHKVWWAVLERGGYEDVTGAKLWKDICRCLDIDLTGQTSASFNMRINYERCLLDFENYCACGKYLEDVQAGCAPLSSHLTDPTTTRFSIPGAYTATGESLAGRPLGGTTASGAGTHRPRRQAAAAGVAAAAAALAHPNNRVLRQRVHRPMVEADEEEEFLEEEEEEEGEEEDLEAQQQANDDAALIASCDLSALEDFPDDELVLGEVAGGEVRRWRPLTAGDAIHQLGGNAIGKTVERYWPEEGGWWPAEVCDFNPETGEHCLTYNKGKEDETFEWADFAEMSDEEIRYPDGGTAALLKGYSVKCGIPAGEVRRIAAIAEQAEKEAEEQNAMEIDVPNDKPEQPPPEAALPKLVLKIKPPTL